MCKHGTTHLMPINGRVQSIDACVAHIVAALNAGGVPTLASCCGHGHVHGVISLADGRELVIMSIEERERHFRQFPTDIHGVSKEADDD
jgi:hypothetical protein